MFNCASEAYWSHSTDKLYHSVLNARCENVNSELHICSFAWPLVFSKSFSPHLKNVFLQYAVSFVCVLCKIAILSRIPYFVCRFVYDVMLMVVDTQWWMVWSAMCKTFKEIVWECGTYVLSQWYAFEYQEQYDM